MPRSIAKSMLFVFATGLPLIFAGSAESALAADANPLGNLKAGEWYEVPDSRLDAVAPQESKFPWLRGNVGGVIDCWAGGAFDTQRDRLYIGPGGGHAGYNGNEVYAFDMHDLKWRRINDPDPVIPGTEYTDLNKAPFAMHTYDGVQYLPPPVDRYIVIGGWGTPRTYALDPDHPDHWEVFAAFQRGFSSEVALDVVDIVKDSTLVATALNYPDLTIVAGDSFQIECTASYSHGADRFERRATNEATWSSDAPDVATDSQGLIRAIRPGGPTKIHASVSGKTATALVTVTKNPVIRRISFQVQSKSPRAGWDADNGQAYTDDRGFGWLDTHDLAQRDDRASAHHQLLMRFVKANENKFKLKVPRGQYMARIAMGDADYGAVPFAEWTSVGSEKLIYYAGHQNNVATKIVTAGDDGLVFSVKGSINYLVVAPVGTDLEKYADDGP